MNLNSDTFIVNDCISAYVLTEYKGTVDIVGCLKHHKGFGNRFFSQVDLRIHTLKFRVTACPKE